MTPNPPPNPPPQHMGGIIPQHPSPPKPPKPPNCLFDLKAIAVEDSGSFLTARAVIEVFDSSTLSS